MQSAVAPVAASQPSPAYQAVLRSLYTHNPFYLLSAGLILYGFHVSFRPDEGELINPWALMAALCGYTLFLAVTAFLIVRFGKVWDDARSLVLVLLLLFLAVSVSFDEIVNTSPAQGIGLLIFGLGFSIAVTEGLLRGLSLRLPYLFRGPYYAILVLFFTYPLLVSPEVTDLPSAAIDLRIYLFPAVAGIAFLCLIPAIRRGSAHVRHEASPWRWPWYPWTAFGFLALGVCLRSYGLSLSFSPAHGMESTFGLYFLVPFCLALLVVALEIGIVQKIRALQLAVLAIAPGLLLLSIPVDEGSAPYREFLATLTATFGSPIYIALLGLIVFYAWAWLRGMRHGEWALTGALLLAAFVIGRRTVDSASLTAGEWWPLALLSTVQLWLGQKYRCSARSFVAALSAIAAATLAFRDTKFIAWHGAVPLHLALVAALIIGFGFSDRFALFLRKIAAIALPCFALFAVCLPQPDSIPTIARVGYLLLLTAMAFGGWFPARDRWYLVAGGINSASLLHASLSSLQGTWNRTISTRGFQPLVWGLVCFFVAAWISATKGKQFRKFQSRLATHDKATGGDRPDG